MSQAGSQDQPAALDIAARHPAATEMRAAGIDAETRMASIGHSTADSQDRYQHVRADHVADAAATLAAHYAGTA